MLTLTNQHPLSELPKPEEIEAGRLSRLGGYRTVMILLAVLWGVGLLLLLFYRKRPKNETFSQEPDELTLHDKLQVLVCLAANGALDEDGRAQLERLIIGHCKSELPELDSMPMAEALGKLRDHPEASPLILKIEHWLHASHQGEVDLDEINEMLKPFQKLGGDQ